MAVMVVLHGPEATATPCSLILTTRASSVLQVIGEPVTGRSLRSTTAAWNCPMLPSLVKVVGELVMRTSVGTCVTTTATSVLFPPAVARTVAVPLATAVTSPLWETVTALPFATLQVTPTPSN